MSASTGAYAKGKSIEHAHESHHHVMPVKTYMQVFGALLALTAITYVVSYLDLGSAALPIAMLVAFIKAGFVVGFFMHLKFDTRFHAFVFLSTLLFVAIFFVLTFFDINTRAMMNPIWDNKTLVHDTGALNRPALRDTEAIPAAELEELRKHHAEGGHH